MDKKEKRRLLIIYSKAAKQAQAIMGMDMDCEINNNEYRKLKREIISDSKVFTLVKNYKERSENSERR